MRDAPPSADALHLRRVVLRGADEARPDPLLARMRLERTLATTDWTPAWLPRGALLFVRSLRVRGQAFAGGAGASSGAMPWRGDAFAEDRAFAARVADALREQGRVARRPWREPGAIADAVWFEDEHELAACLVRDWLQGRAAQRWWWRDVLAGAGVEAWLRATLLHRGERLAPALQRLASASLATAWLARMDDTDADAGVEALARAYALPRAAAHADATSDGGLPDAWARDGRGMGGQGQARSQAAFARARLQRIVPELRAAAWRPAQARLLAWSLALRRAPAEARSPAFARAVEAWRPASRRAIWPVPGDDVAATRVAEAGDASAGHDRAVAPRPMPSSSARRHVIRRVADDSTAAVAAPVPAPRAAPAIPAPPASTSRDASPARGDAAMDRVDVHESATPLATGGEGAHPPSAAMHGTVPVVDAPGPVATAGDARAVADGAVIACEGVEEGAREILTDHGGLFYVLNAALALGLYGDFSAPRAQGLGLSPWDLLAWLGRHWFGRGFRRDPLWRLLAGLSGRSPRRAPAWQVDAPRHWEPDDAWLRAWAPMARLDHRVERRGAGDGGARGARLQVLHPAGFALFDVPRDTRQRPAAQARALCMTRGCASRARLRHRAGIPARAPAVDPGQRWLECLADYLAARFARALGVASPGDAVALLCRHRAAVRCDASRVEVSLALSTLPLPVRIAGLDRDPGWIPAAGRDVRFHFS